MADSNRYPKDIIDDAINFIEKERELYGDFSVNPKSKESTQDESPASQSTSAGSSSNNTVTEPSLQETSSSKNNQQEEGFTPQEGLFNKDESNDVYYHIDKCNSLDELNALCQKADVLRTDLEGTQLVFGVGNPDADLMIIGEAPGAEEDKQGEPFVGKAGQLLNKILDAINFKREDVYIANILKHRPPNNRNPKPEERERSLPFLLRQIDLIEPKLILAVGKVAAQTLLDKNLSLTKMRGQFHDFRGKYELLATYHPAALLRHPKWKRPTWKDVQLLRERYDELGGQP
ncbi:uracil-DNA glycosylase [Aliifodinibius salipaludis]|uniref:Type-4 uracil-DNA glycosylase n=1 Tax=Fodinibius salipaludis TaxID=2032627 RepID=A0A2A2G7M2_9BACT|nr:uracil-DNA glycosylase [Aliifodinibius salipaludis]PAU92859.1 uracil-DNA glycosylase [Aliifodinibius salipaludis]